MQPDDLSRERVSRLPEGALTRRGILPKCISVELFSGLSQEFPVRAPGALTKQTCHQFGVHVEIFSPGPGGTIVHKADKCRNILLGELVWASITEGAPKKIVWGIK